MVLNVMFLQLVSLILLLVIFTHTVCESQVVGSESEDDWIYSSDFQSSWDIVIHKCCGPKQILSEDGRCLPIDQQVSANLEKRITRALKEAPRYGSKTEDVFRMKLFQQRPFCEPGERNRLVYNISSEDLEITPSLQFVTNYGQNHSLIVDYRDYCIDWTFPDSIIIEYCINPRCHSISQHLEPFPSPVSSKYHGEAGSPITRPPCLRKCCPASHMIDISSFSCVKKDIPWQLFPITFKQTDTSPNSSLFDDIVPNALWSERKTPLHASWLTGTPRCENYYQVYTDTYEKYYINRDGILITEQLGTVAKTPPAEYCFDAVSDTSGSSNVPPNDLASPDNETTSSKSTNDKGEGPIFSRQIAIVCFEEVKIIKEKEPVEEKFDWRAVYTVLTGISCFFLFITCIIYVILWKDLNLPGWLQFAYALVLFLTFTLLTIAQLWTQRIHDISKSLCRALGYGLHFFFLSCFFWLTSMNVDLWLSFRSSAITRGFGKSRGKRRFFAFAVFSTGFPAAITILVFAVDNYVKDNPDWQHIFWALPSSGIGENSCLIDIGNKAAQFRYFYGFVGVLLQVNLVIFICTLISLRNRELETRFAKRQSTSNADYDRLQLFTRLFLIMGILWIFEVISWAFEAFEVNKNIMVIFAFTDCLNALQGCAVFIMFVWKKQTWKQLKKKLKPCFGMRATRPLSRPAYNCTTSSNGNNGTTKSSSMKSSYFSSTKSTDSSRLPSPSTVTTVENDSYCPTDKATNRSC